MVGRGEALGVGVGDEGQGKRFVVAERKRMAAKGGIDGGMGQLNDRPAVSGESVFELVVAVQTRDFFDDVDFAFNVEPPAWDVYAELLVALALWDQGESEALEQAENLAGIETASQDALYFGNAQQDGSLIQRTRDDIDRIADQFASA